MSKPRSKVFNTGSSHSIDLTLEAQRGFDEQLETNSHWLREKLNHKGNDTYDSSYLTESSHGLYGSSESSDGDQHQPFVDPDPAIFETTAWRSRTSAGRQALKNNLLELV